MALIDLSKKRLDEIFKGIWTGRIQATNLPVDLYTAIALLLEKGLFSGFGGTLQSYDLNSPDLDVLKALRKNTYFFSAAKTFQEVKATQAFIFTPDGFRRSFTDFKKDAEKVMDVFNEAWLETEYNTTIAAAQSAAEWIDIQEDKDIFPLLRYVTQKDENVRHSHRSLDGIVKPVNDPFWRNNMPPNGWNCRCHVEQLEEGDTPETKLTEERQDQVNAATDDLFKVNFARDKVVFKEDGRYQHEYFKVAKKYEVLKNNHFNLPRPTDATR